MAWKLLLYEFELASGLKINVHKVWSVSLMHMHLVIDHIANMLHCEKATYPLNYFGVLIRPIKPHYDDW